MRQLATVQVISNLKEIPGKDLIVLAQFKSVGWEVIVRKDQVNIDDFVVYFEPDSLLPLEPQYEFLKKSCLNQYYNRYRIRVMKMAGVYSYGLAVPLSSVPLNKSAYREGYDVTDKLNVTKYDPEDFMGKPTTKPHVPWWLSVLYYLGLVQRPKYGFPSYVPKTDETRLQSITHALGHLKNLNWHITMKLDGTSATYVCNKGKFLVCSRNRRLQRSDKKFHSSLQTAGNCYWAMVDKYDIENKLKAYCKEHKRNIAIQGEIVGSGIQKNPHKLSDRRLYVYQIWDIDKQVYLDRFDYVNLCVLLGLKSVPFLKQEYYPKEHTIDGFIKASIIKGSLEDDTEEAWFEGIVVRPDIETTVPNMFTVHNRLSFKVINPEYSIKEQ